METVQQPMEHGGQDEPCDRKEQKPADQRVDTLEKVTGRCFHTCRAAPCPTGSSRHWRRPCATPIVAKIHVSDDTDAECPGNNDRGPEARWTRSAPQIPRGLRAVLARHVNIRSPELIHDELSLGEGNVGAIIPVRELVRADKVMLLAVLLDAAGQLPLSAVLEGFGLD